MKELELAWSSILLLIESLTGESMPKDQARVLRAARIALGMTSKQLAQSLGVKLPTLRSWITPETSKVHREMPKTAILLLRRILEDERKK